MNRILVIHVSEADRRFMSGLPVKSGNGPTAVLGLS